MISFESGRRLIHLRWRGPAPFCFVGKWNQRIIAASFRRLPRFAVGRAAWQQFLPALHILHR